MTREIDDKSQKKVYLVLGLWSSIVFGLDRFSNNISKHQIRKIGGHLNKIILPIYQEIDYNNKTIPKITPSDL